jgi:hypothetical protein
MGFMLLLAHYFYLFVLSGVQEQQQLYRPRPPAPPSPHIMPA